MIAQALHLVSRFGPRPLQFDARSTVDFHFIRHDAELVLGVGAADHLRVSCEPRAGTRCAHHSEVFATHLDHRTQFLVEEHSQIALGLTCVKCKIAVHGDAGAAREHHFAQRHEQAAVRAIVIGEKLRVRVERLNKAEEAAQQHGIIDVRRFAPNLPVHLRQR